VLFAGLYICDVSRESALSPGAPILFRSDEREYADTCSFGSACAWSRPDRALVQQSPLNSLDIHTSGINRTEKPSVHKDENENSKLEYENTSHLSCVSAVSKLPRRRDCMNDIVFVERMYKGGRIRRRACEESKEIV